MLHRAFIGVLLLLGLLVSYSQAQSAQPTSQPLWPDGAPGALGHEAKDSPTITPYLVPTTKPSAAFVILPGGGYQHLSEHEGAGFAQFLNLHGYDAFVVKYRLGSSGYRHPAMLQDASRAVRMVRANAMPWGIDPTRVVIVGSSAGGHLAATLLTHFDDGDPKAKDAIDRQSSRPDFGTLVYPVITMDSSFTHAGSRKNLLGDDPDPTLVDSLSNEKQVSEHTPPCFIWAGVDDRVVPVQNSLAFASALAAQHVPYELHLYQHAGHGSGLGDNTPPFSNAAPWTNDWLAWLKLNGM